MGNARAEAIVGTPRDQTIPPGRMPCHGLPPDGTTFTINACVGGYAGTNLDNPSTGPAFAVYQTQGSIWVALNAGSAGVCDGLGIPPAVAEQIGCV